jgi:Uma2 family endonuclease
MASDPRPRVSPEDYLAIERRSETRSEYLDGEIFAMTGASERHNLLAGNLYTIFRAQLRPRGCRVYVSDMRVKVSATGLYTYPDVIVVCGKPQFEDAEVDTLLNPQVIVEVLSKSTEDYDRGTKFVHYRTIPSLTEYLLVAQDRVHVEHHLRQNEGWLLTETDRLEDVLEIPSVGARLDLAEVYDAVF